MSRATRSLVAVATVALIGAGGSSSYAATHGTASKQHSSAPGTLPAKGSAGPKKPSKGSSGSRHRSPLAPGRRLPR